MADQFLPRKKSQNPENMEGGLAPQGDAGPEYDEMPIEQALYTNPDPMTSAIKRLRNKVADQKNQEFY